MAISAQQVQKLRQISGAGVMDVKQALAEAEGDLEKAHEILRKKGILKAAKKADRETRQGRVEAYVHTNAKIGVLVKLYCETDFVANNEQFSRLSHDIAMHIAAANPRCIAPSDIPPQDLEIERRIYEEQLQEVDKPQNIRQQIIDGKMKKFAEEVCLLTQSFVKDPDKTVGDLIKEYIAKLGENIQVGGFVRLEL